MLSWEEFKMRLIMAEKSGNKDVALKSLLELNVTAYNHYEIFMSVKKEAMCLARMLEGEEQLLIGLFEKTKIDALYAYASYKLTLFESIYYLLEKYIISDLSEKVNSEKIYYLTYRLSELVKKETMPINMRQKYDELLSNIIENNQSSYDIIRYCLKSLNTSDKIVYYLTSGYDCKESILRSLDGRENLAKEVILLSEDFEINNCLLKYIKSDEVFKELLEKSDDWYVKEHARDQLEKSQEYARRKTERVTKVDKPTTLESILRCIFFK